jgi:flagellar hook-length control protein FliK
MPTTDVVDKPNATPDAKSTPKASAKPVIKSDAKPASKIAAEPSIKPDAKPVAEIAAKPNLKTDAKPVATPSADTGKAGAARVATDDPTGQPQQKDSTSADDQDGKAVAPNPQDRIVKQDQPAAPSAKPEQATASPAPSPQIQQPVVPSASQIVAGTPATATPARMDAAQTPLPYAQPNIGAIAAAIAAKSVAGSKTFEIRLDPSELGHVDVHLTVENDGRVQATVMADRPHTLDLLQQGSHDLERALKDAGLNLSNNSLNFSLKGEGRQGDGGGASMARTRSLTSAVVARAEAVNASEINLSSANGRLDIRV